MKARGPLVFTLLLTVLSGCAAPRAGAATPDSGPVTPYEKLSQARVMYMQKGDAHAAEKLIRQAMDAFAADHDDHGLADAYQRYAYFLESDAVEKERDAYKRDGFLDKTITWGNRLDKSIEYFDKAAPIFAKEKRFDRLVDNSLGQGIVFTILNKTDEACASYDQAASFRDEALSGHPDARLSTPKEYKTWDDYLAHLKHWAGCH